MATNFVELYDEKTPPWLYGTQGEAWCTAFGLVFDATHDAAVIAVKCRMPQLAPADAVPYIGSERNFDRVPRETIEQYRNRLKSAWEAWRYAGTDKGVVDQLSLTGLTANIVRNNQWTVDANAGNVQYYWARFWVLIDTPTGWASDDVWGTGTWGSGLWGLSANITDEDIQYIQKTIVKWKHAPCHCISAIVLLSGGVWGYPLDDDWGTGTWGGSAAYLKPEG